MCKICNVFHASRLISNPMLVCSDVFLLLRFPAISLGFTIFGEICAYVTLFLNPIIEVVTFCLHGWGLDVKFSD